MKNINIFLLFIILLSFGCSDDFLEEIHPTKFSSEVFFTNDDEARQAAVSLYDAQRRLFADHFDGYMGAFDIFRGDDIIIPKNFNNNSLTTWVTLNYNDETGTVRDAWRYNYQIIYKANWIINNVTDNQDISSDVAKNVLAEAYFMRGFSYFNLTRYFEEVPLMIKQTSTDTYYPEKASNEECWAQVFSDYQKALDLGIDAPTENFMDGRANSGVVHAMMARAYFQRTRPGSNQYWDKVKEHTQAVENLGVYDLETIEDFVKMFTYTSEDKWVKNKEMIWGAGNVYGPIYGGVPFTYVNRSFMMANCMPVGYAAALIKNDAGDNYLMANGRTGRARYALSTSISDIILGYFEQGDKRVENTLYYPTFNNYELADKNDFTSVEVKEVVKADSLYDRIKTTDGAEGEYIHVKKYQVQEFIGTNIWDGGWNHSLIAPIIRYADVLLMRAEAEYQLGNEGIARAYLKQITDRAGFAADYVDGFSGQALLDEILQQRRVELVFEPSRVPDLIRLEMFKPPYVGTYPGSVPWDEKLKILPIPQRELDMNKNLIQHDLWR